LDDPAATDAARADGDALLHTLDTPAMRQFRRFKEAHPGCLLFFRMGDFYELFGEDAVVAHRALDITLTERTRGVPMAGVPHHAAEQYLRRLVEQGFRVAIADQIQDPKDAKGVVDRAVVRVVTPGTLVDDHLLDDGASNRIAAVAAPTAEGDRWAIATIELSTGVFSVLDVDADEISDRLMRLRPQELLVPADAHGDRPDWPWLAEGVGCPCPATPRPGWTFTAANAASELQTTFAVASVEGFGLDPASAATGACGAVLRYVTEMAATDAELGAGRLGHLQPPRCESDRGRLEIDAVALRSLEVERTVRGGDPDGSLVGSMRRCRTPMGRRLIREWLCFPSADLEVVRRRHRRVATLVDDRRLSGELRRQLDRIQDVARIGGRLGLRRATPRDLAALARSIESAAQLRDELADVAAFDGDRSDLAAVLTNIEDLARETAAVVVESPPTHLREGGAFRDGADAALDGYRRLHRDGGGWLEEYRERLAERTGIASLKIGFNRVFGFYIEIGNAHRAASLPESFVRRQSLKNAERYSTPELADHETKVLEAERRSLERERELFEELAGRWAEHLPALSGLAVAVGTLDVLVAFAETAVAGRWVEPEMREEPILEIVAGRHPVLDRLLRDRFVPNDCRLRAGDAASDPAESASLALITGPNMAGKSTFIRQAALIVLLAHAGSFVPAESAVIGLCDRIHTRIGANDELHGGQSTFMVEMTETARLLRQATERSLVVLDEIGRGTSTFDGLSLAWAIAETLADRGTRTLLATHYHELTELAERHAAVRNLNVAVREWGDRIVFLHRIEPGRADRSYGLHVARLAGVPEATVARAEALLAGHEAAASRRSGRDAASRRQPTLFDALAADAEGNVPSAATPPAPLAPPPAPPAPPAPVEHPIVEIVRDTEIDRLSPLEAFDLVRRLRDRLGASDARP
jgi:DNA mismatch repair protein MutS